MANVSKTQIFLTGATGYIGGSVLNRLLEHPAASTFDITAYLRNADKAKILESKFGVKAAVGTHAELDKLEALAENAHVVFSCADSDDLPAIQAILRGMRKRHATVGDLPILIHTSGTGELTDKAAGMYATDTIYSDLDPDQIEALPATALHRDVDLTIVEADKQGYVRAHIVMPSTIYGFASGPLIDAGVSNRHSIQIPNLIRAALDRRRGGIVGKGVAIWPDVHIDDVSDLYMVIYDTIVARPENAGHGREGYYFGENGEHTWGDIGHAIGAALFELGISDSPEPTPFTTEELIKYWGTEAKGNYNGSNSRCRGERGRAIGWKPVYTTADMLMSIKPEVEALIEKESFKIMRD